MTAFPRALAALLAAGLAGSPLSALAAPAPAPDLAGDWVLHIYVGNRLFDDTVHVERDARGAYAGTLTVPDRFTSPLEKVVVDQERARFEIVGHERGHAFRVIYDGRWDPKHQVFAGLATLLDEGGALLGGFVAQRAADAPPLAPTPPLKAR